MGLLPHAVQLNDVSAHWGGSISLFLCRATYDTSSLHKCTSRSYHLSLVFVKINSWYNLIFHFIELHMALEIL